MTGMSFYSRVISDDYKNKAEIRAPFIGCARAGAGVHYLQCRWFSIEGTNLFRVVVGSELPSFKCGTGKAVGKRG
ncbi:hypothetical protein MnBA_22490 [Marinobacterium sp. BA1]